MSEPASNLLDIAEARSRRTKNFQDPAMGFISQSTGVTRQETFESLKEEVREILRTGKETILESVKEAVGQSTRQVRVTQIQREILGTIRVSFLPNKSLKIPIDAVLERDGEGYIARTLEMPLYGSGEDAWQAIDALKWEIESLYDDLMEDDNFADEWLKIKEFLRQRID
jgi:hypothetical protein